MVGITMVSITAAFRAPAVCRTEQIEGHKETIRQAALDPLKWWIVTFILQTNFLSMKKDKSLKDMSVYEASEFWDDHDFTEFGDIQGVKDI